MKKTILFLLLAFGMNVMTAQTKKAKPTTAAKVSVPSNIETRFGSDYPNTTATWSMDGKYYVATYKDKNGMGKTVVYDKKADFIRSDMEASAGYPSAIGDYFKKNYPKDKYTVWFSNDDYGEAVYYSVRKGKTLWFDKNGTYSAKKPGHYK
ncbi:MAG: hypothetical protein K0S33_455 [Bacteroidetes bacterium]|jgi:hypothetical protein|nr:hypothetical protein [Bacteroidota bacterium]